ncbi:hypothetical protein EMCRGX_G017462 [Ephydatia muelleri]
MSKRTRKLPPRYKDNAIPLHHGIEESNYWRVNSSSLDGALLLDFITQGPSYKLFTTMTKDEKVCVPSGDTKQLGRQTFLHSRHIRYQATNQSLKRNGLLKDNDIVRVLNMLIQRKVKATQSS